MCPLFLIYRCEVLTQVHVGIIMSDPGRFAGISIFFNTRCIILFTNWCIVDFPLPWIWQVCALIIFIFVFKLKSISFCLGQIHFFSQFKFILFSHWFRPLKQQGNPSYRKFKRWFSDKQKVYTYVNFISHARKSDNNQL